MTDTPTVDEFLASLETGPKFWVNVFRAFFLVTYGEFDVRSGESGIGATKVPGDIEHGRYLPGQKERIWVTYSPGSPVSLILAWSTRKDAQRWRLSKTLAARSKGRLVPLLLEFSCAIHAESAQRGRDRHSHFLYCAETPTAVQDSYYGPRPVSWRREGWWSQSQWSSWGSHSWE